MSTPFHDRLQESIENHGLTQKEFAEIIGVSESTASRLLRGQQRMPLDPLMAYVSRYGVSVAWLLQGLGPPGRAELEEALEHHANAAHTLSELEALGKRPSGMLMREARALVDMMQPVNVVFELYKVSREIIEPCPESASRLMQIAEQLYNDMTGQSGHGVR